MNEHKYRFFCHVWTPQSGHKDKRYLMTGPTMQDALGRLEQVLTARYPGILVNAKRYQQIY